MTDRRHGRMRVVNALDHPEVPMVPAPNEGTMLPEFSSDGMEAMLFAPKQRRDPVDFLSAPGVDPWPVIRQRLTPRQFEVFEYVYRYQLSVTDIMEVMDLSRQSVHKILNAAKRKVRKDGRKDGKKSKNGR